MSYISYIIAILLSFTAISCFTDTSSDTKDSIALILNKRWRIPQYIVTRPTGYTWICEGYAGYLLEFKALNNELNVNTGVTIRTGTWAVYEGPANNVLQIFVPEVIKDVYQLSGKWIIEEQTITTLKLRQVISDGTILQMNLQEF